METWQPRGGTGVIATGHQAALWHPGILAKDIAAAHVAKRFRMKVVHVVVDSDAHDTAAFDVPVVDGDRLSAKRIELGRTRADVPTGMQPPVEVDVDALPSREDLNALVDAVKQLPPCDNLAQQMATLTTRMMQPYTGDVTLVYASKVVDNALVETLLDDAAACAKAYNDAVAQHPQAGIAPLRVEPDRIELPLWSLAWQQPRRRVFADIADSAPLLVDETGEVVSRDNLAPRALMLTAIMRSKHCDLFIHGTGGYIYDRITEQWWQQWRGNDLAPMAMATADVFLPFDVPVADEADLATARWRVHHLPHNVDRFVDVDAQLAAEKRDLLSHMHDDRDRTRRAAAFARLHEINAELAARHADLITDARRDLDRTLAGLHNRDLARRRDWFFGLYPSAALRDIL